MLIIEVGKAIVKHWVLMLLVAIMTVVLCELYVTNSPFLKLIVFSVAFHLAMVYIRWIFTKLLYE